MPAHDAGPRPHLTKEQDEQRLRGLRALARLIVRHHLAATASRQEPGKGARGDAPGEEDGRAE